MWELRPPSFCTSIHRRISNCRTFPLLAHTNHRSVTPIKQPVPLLMIASALSTVIYSLIQSANTLGLSNARTCTKISFFLCSGRWAFVEGRGGCKYHPLSLAEHAKEMEQSAGLRPVSSTVRLASTLTPSKRSRGIICQDGDERRQLAGGRSARIKSKSVNERRNQRGCLCKTGGKRGCFFCCLTNE